MFEAAHAFGERKSARQHEEGIYTYQDGRKYIGRWKNDIEHGWGVCMYPGGEVYAGRWRNGEAHGKGVYMRQDKSIHSGRWRNGILQSESVRPSHNDMYIGERKLLLLMHGFGAYIYPDGSMYAGRWKNSKREGAGLYIYKSGGRYMGRWANNVYHGWGTYTYAVEGDVYEGNWKDGKKHGYGACQMTDGSVYKGNWEDGKIQGYGVYEQADGSVYEGNWENDKKHGYGVYEQADGSVYKGNWEDGKIQGYGVYQKADGSVYEGNWKDNRILIDVKKQKQKNTIPTIIFRSQAMRDQYSRLKYEMHKFLPGGAEIRVVVMPPEGRLDEMLKESGILECEHQDRLRFIFCEHGSKNGRSDVKHTSEHFTDLLKLCGERGIYNTSFSDCSCYGGATRQLHNAKIPDNMEIRHHQSDHTSVLCEALGNDTEGQTRFVTRWRDERRQYIKRHRHAYKDGKWTTAML